MVLSAAVHQALAAALRRAIPPPEGPAGPLYTMLAYHLGWGDPHGRPTAGGGGKGIRPRLCLLACAACGGDPLRAVPAAAAVELVHNFTLLHDDVQDQSAERRHRPTVWALWGTAQAITAGDALYALARQTILGLANAGLPAAQVVEAARLLDEACLAVCEGQYLDVAFETRAAVSAEEYLAMSARKTGALFGCALELGALVAGAGDAVRAALRRCGRWLGLAFQAQDDLLGAWGDPAVTGKPAADDVRQRKKTLLVVQALAGPPALAERLRALYAQPALDEAAVAEVLRLFEDSGARAAVEAAATTYYTQALAELDGLPLTSEGRAALTAATQELVGRKR
jgi:geranylgeranyl diphosphate synthase type I